MKHMSQREVDTATKVLDQYNLDSTQRALAEFQLGEEAWAGFKSFNAYTSAHVIAARIEGTSHDMDVRISNAKLAFERSSFSF